MSLILSTGESKMDLGIRCVPCPLPAASHLFPRRFVLVTRLTALGSRLPVPLPAAICELSSEVNVIKDVPHYDKVRGVKLGSDGFEACADVSGGAVEWIVAVHDSEEAAAVNEHPHEAGFFHV